MGEETAKALIEELRALRGRRGMTAARLSDSSTILKALGTTSGEEARQQIAELLDRLGADNQVAALKAAFAIDLAEFHTLSDRRSKFASQVDRHPDSVETWEEKIIRELARMIESGLNSSGVYTPTDPILVPNEYVVTETVVTIHVRERSIAALETYHRFKHKKTGDYYVVYKETEDDYRDLNDFPDDHEVVVFNPPHDSDSFCVDLIFNTGFPAFWRLERFESLEDIGLRRGTVVAEEQRSVTDAVSAAMSLRDEAPIPGCYYRVSWEY